MYNRGYQPYSIPITQREKEKKKNYKALFSCIVRKVSTIAEYNTHLEKHLHCHSYGNVIKSNSIHYIFKQQ